MQEIDHVILEKKVFEYQVILILNQFVASCAFQGSDARKKINGSSIKSSSTD